MAGRRAVPVSEVLRRVLPRAGAKRAYSLELLAAEWSKIVGPELARRTEPAWLDAGALAIRVADPQWGRTVLQHEGAIRRRIAEVLGPGRVRRLHFVCDGRPLPERRPPGAPRGSRDPEPGAAPAGLARLAERIEDPELRERALTTAARYLAALRRKGS